MVNQIKDDVAKSGMTLLVVACLGLLLQFLIVLGGFVLWLSDDLSGNKTDHSAIAALQRDMGDIKTSVAEVKAQMPPAYHIQVIDDHLHGIDVRLGQDETLFNDYRERLTKVETRVGEIHDASPPDLLKGHNR